MKGRTGSTGVRSTLKDIGSQVEEFQRNKVWRQNRVDSHTVMKDKSHLNYYLKIFSRSECTSITFHILCYLTILHFFNICTQIHDN